jgi:hypothetical protein
LLFSGSLKLLPASWCVQVNTGLQTQGLENFLDDGLLEAREVDLQLALKLPVVGDSKWPARTGQQTDSTVRSAPRSSHSSGDDGFPLRGGPPISAPHRSWTTLSCLSRRGTAGAAKPTLAFAR